MSYSVDNEGIVMNTEDYRLKDKKVFNLIKNIKNKLKRSINIKIYNLIKKIYTIFKFLVFKIKNSKNNKYFK